MQCAGWHTQAVARRVGYHTPSSRDSPEIVYATDVYSESLQRKSASPASKKRFKDQLGADIDELSAQSSDPDLGYGGQDSRGDRSMVRGARARGKANDGQAQSS